MTPLIRLIPLLTACAALLNPSGCRPRVSDAAPPTSGPFFEEVSARAGVEFTHDNGAFGKKLFPEIMGSGAAWFDADGDGWLDLLLINSGSLPGDPKPRKSSNRFYRNRGDGTFEDWTDRSGLSGGGYGMGVAVGDVDNDGDPDVFITQLGENLFYRNLGKGIFRNETTQAGLLTRGYGSSAAFLDYDNDGNLDLFVANYVELPDPIERIVCHNPKGGIQYCDVHLYDGLPARLYHNEGNGKFKDVSQTSGIAKKRGRGLAVICSDFDEDGRQDILVANDENPNYLWLNRGDGTFREAAAEVGVAYDQRGEAPAGMGLDLGDVDGDGRLDLYESGFQSEPNLFFRNESPGVFVDRTGNLGIGELTRQFLSFGLGFLDYDLDAKPDLFVTNGHVIDDVTEFNPSIPYEQTPTLFRNVGGGRLADASPDLGTYAKERWVGRGVAFGDFDNDGSPDLAVTHNHQRAVVLRNRNHTGRHWLRIRCIGTRSNRDAYGTRVTVTAGGVRQTKEVRAASSYLSSNDPRLLFGLGEARTVDRIEVRWPDGSVQQVPGGAANRTVEITQGPR